VQIEEVPVGESTEKESKMFPEKEQSKEKITCHDMSRDFLIYGTDVSQYHPILVPLINLVYTIAVLLRINALDQGQMHNPHSTVTRQPTYVTMI
jgi:hypothetical protein